MFLLPRYKISLMGQHKKGIDAYRKMTGRTIPPAVEAAEGSPALRSSEPTKPPLPQQQTSPPSTPPGLLKTGREKSLRKVAKFLILLGHDEAAKVVRHLSPAEIEEISREIALIKTVDAAEAEKILLDFGYMASRLPGSSQGGNEVAQAILQGAFGPEKSRKILHKAVPGSAPRPFQFLADLDPSAVAALLKNESLNVLGLALPYLEKPLAAKVLSSLDNRSQKDLIKRLAKLEKVSQEVLSRVEQGLREKAHHLGDVVHEEVDGKARLAEILRHMDSNQEQTILRTLEASAPEVTREIREKLFTVTSLLQVLDEDMEVLLREEIDADLAVILKGLPPEVEPKLSTNMSGRRLALIRQEQDLLGPIPVSEVRRAVKAFLEKIRDQVRAGQIRLTEKGEDYL